MKAVIMAGGEGTRLRPLTCDTPKPLVKLCGRPISEYILDLLQEHGCENAVFTLRYLGEKIEKHFESGKYGSIKLDFSYEETSLGTAGCVKKAVNCFDITDDCFVVISGDAMCDFNLTAAIDFHKANKSEATIIVKQVDDPREYGLVVQKDGVISGFSEKPSYLGCVSEFANTGVYILSPKVLKLIPEGKMWDFAKDVFPEMLKRKMKLMSFTENGYWCDIGDLRTYKSCQNDMLSGKVRYNAGETINSFVPKGVVINKPCYIGQNFSAGSGTIIEAGTVICDNVTIGCGSHLNGAIILSGAFLGEKTTVNAGILGENVKLESGVSVFEDAVVGSDSVIERGTVIKSGVRIWANKTIPSFKIIGEDVKYGSSGISEISEKGISGETNADITPAFLTKLGSAAASAFKGKTLIASEKNLSSAIFKAAICVGFSSAGSDIIDCGALTLPMLIQSSRIHEAEQIMYISSSSHTDILLLSQGGLPLTRVTERKLENYLNKGEYANAQWNSFGSVKSFKGAELLYRNWLETFAGFKSRYNINVQCNNPAIKKIAERVFSSVSNTSGQLLTVKLNHRGSRAEFFVSEDEKADWTKLVSIVCSEKLKTEKEIAVPVEFPSVAEFMAESLGGKVFRYFRCPNDNSDEKAREIARNEAFLFDGIVLALNVLEILTSELITLHDYVFSLPQFAQENRFLRINIAPQKVLNSFLNENCSIGEGVVVGDSGERVLLRSNKRGDGLLLYAESVSTETAKALCDDIEKRVNEFLSKKKNEQ